MSSQFTVLHPNAAGIDIASTSHFVCVPEGRSLNPIRKFGGFTEDLHEMARWLKECQIDTVAMESTGVYWIQAYLILEEYGFEVYLVNARHIKNVSGRKTDVKDCQWIQQLHTYGLLNNSFQPDDLTRELRTYTRQRKNLTGQASTQVHLMQKSFDQMNIKLHNVISDITGKSGTLIIESILNGERNAQILAEQAESRIKASQEDLIKSLEGIWRDDNLFELRQAYELYNIFRDKICECDVQIQAVLDKIISKNGNNTNSVNQTNAAKKKIKRKTKSSLNFNAESYLKTLIGVDLTEIFGINELTAIQILSEIGTDLSAWKTEKHFTSWLNLAPNTKISGGKKLKGKAIKRTNKAGQAFLMAASTLKASKNWLGEFYRRIKAKRGAPVAIKATARKLAIILYKMMNEKIEFNPIPIEEYNQNFKERKIKYISKQAKLLGYNMVLA